MYAQHNLSQAGSRRGSADTGWQVHQNYPGSRRGSKEESLTTILVTSQGSPASRSVPASPRLNKPATPEKAAGSTKRQSVSKQLPSAIRQSIPTSRSQAINSATATTEQPSGSTQPSPLAATKDETAATTKQLNAIASNNSDESLFRTGDGPSDVGSAHHASAPAALPATPPETHLILPPKSESPRIVARMASDDSAHQAIGSKESHGQVRQSRSRSRLRGLKFWKRRRDDVEGPDEIPHT